MFLLHLQLLPGVIHLIPTKLPGWLDGCRCTSAFEYTLTYHSHQGYLLGLGVHTKLCVRVQSLSKPEVMVQMIYKDFS